MIHTAPRLVAVLFIWFVWFVLFVWLNETNEMNQSNQINQMNQINQINQTNETNQLNQLKGGSRSPEYDGAGAPVALTLSRPGGWQPEEEGLVGYAPESSRHWVLRSESSPLSSQT